MDKIKTIFIGSGEFAIPIFKTLLDMPEFLWYGG
jgi:methionyl-tRNA formyltransferase